MDTLTGVPGLYAAFTPPDDPVCPGLPVVAAQAVDLAASTITFAQVQERLFNQNAPPKPPAPRAR